MVEELNPAIDFNAQFSQSLDMMDESGANILVTGRAGTGKSTLLEHFRSVTDKQIAVLAPTGVAAVNVRGQTIHSFFRFRPDMTTDKIKAVKDRVYKELDAIVIDEISMVRADLLDLIDVFLRKNGRKKGAPFGGIQMIFIGDLYQLPPVLTRNDKEVLAKRYDSEYFFDSDVFREVEFELIELEKVYRQTDAFFIDLLNGVRNRSITDAQIDAINARLAAQEEDWPENAIHLTTTNAMARERNERQLARLKGKTYVFEASLSGDFDEKSAPADLRLKLKQGAHVMLLNNDSGGRWVNGTMGILQGFRDESLRIRLPGGEIEPVEPVTWNRFRFVWDDKTRAVKSESTGKFTQFPVKLAWAVTIHKSQGKTFDSIVVDVGRGTFVPGQLYVALSRCRTLDGVFIKAPIKKTHIWLDWRVVKFITDMQYRRSDGQLPLADKIRLVEQAITDGFLLEMTYLKPDDTKSRRKIKPYSVEKMEYRGKPFIGLRARCLKRQADRTFRVDRILEIEMVVEEE
ncbi:MAG: AAA family ATPase [Actinobacteria bacterium]|nr:AAA family ATPase [Actinomycetota bacterium]